MTMLLISMVNLLLICTTTQEYQKEIVVDGFSDIRTSITFILGTDIDSKDHYFDLAKRYHLTHPDKITDYFIDTCSSLLSVRNYLDNLATDEGLRYGIIRLVVHSNQWTGMSVPINEAISRTTANDLIEEIYHERFRPLRNVYLDSLTTISIISCGLGANTDLLTALQIAFGGYDKSVPKVISSENFIEYTETLGGSIDESHYEPFYAFYRTAFRPADLHIEAQLKSRYPREKLNWLDAIQEKFHMARSVLITRFNVPVEWHVISLENLNLYDFSKEIDKIEFVKKQHDLMKIINTYDIPLDKFRWNINTTVKEGTMHIKILGKSTVICVLKKIRN